MIKTEEMADTLDILCPMFVLLDATGHIRRVGPTLQKLRPDQPMAGQRFLELFELSRPRAVNSFQGLLKASGAKLHLKFRDEPQTGLKGAIVALPDGSGAVVNLSFGISVMDAVRDYALNSADFSATDLTIELLYLVEAKSAAMEASRTLNLRLQRMMMAAEEQAYTDMLTGLKNRRALDQVLDRMISGDKPFLLMNLDLDYFKSVNDTLGHAAGDHVLQQAARIMVEETRGDDIVARVGGDEFVLVFDKLCDREKVQSIAERIIERLEEPVPFGNQICRISASAGSVFWCAENATEAADLLHQADLALYAAKRAGRARHLFFEPEMLGSGLEASTVQDLAPVAPRTNHVAKNPGAKASAISTTEHDTGARATGT